MGSAFSKVMVNMQLATENGMGSFDELISLGKDAGVSFEQINYAVQKGGKELKSTASQMGLTTTQLKAMYKESNDAAVSLEQFADVAGMTNAEFGQLFQSNPAEAVMKFVEGLAHAEEKGKSAITVLDDMDITEVRLRDSLLRAANASGIFKDAVELGNKSFKENTALNIEAGKRYETTESKLKMLKNQVVDTAIDLGGPFVDALQDIFEILKPTLENLSNLAKSFSELSKEQQQNILKWGAMIAAVGPAFKILGGGISVIGNTRKAIGTLGGSIVKLAADSAAKTATVGGLTTAVSGVGTAATAAAGTGAATGVAGLAAGIGALAGPAAIAVGAIGAISLAVYAGKKAYEEHQLSGAKWGTKVTEEQDKVISKSYELSEKAAGYVNQYSDGVKGSAKKAVDANKDIVESIQNVIDKEYDRQMKNAKGIKNEETRKAAEQKIADEKKASETIVEQAKIRVGRINAILESASENNRDLSDQERSYISQNYQLLNDDQLKAANFTKDERIKIETAYQQDLTKLSQKELEDRTARLWKGMYKEKDAYQKEADKFAAVWGKGTEAYNKAMDELNKRRRKNTETMAVGYAKIMLAQGKSLEEGKELWKDWGWTVEEIQEAVNASTDNTTKNVDMMAHGTEEFDQRWNQMTIDPKTGEIRTNMVDVLKDLAQTDEGWNQLKLYPKRADLSTNAKEEVAIAIGELNRWGELTLEEKLLYVDNDEAKLKLFETINQLGYWNQYNADRKLLGIDNADAMWKFYESKGSLETWNTLTPEIKTLLANGPAKMTVDEAKNALGQYNALPPETKKLLGENTDVQTRLTEAQQKINGYNQDSNPAKKYLLGDSESIKKASGDGVIAIKDYNGEDIKMKNMEIKDQATETIGNVLEKLSKFQGLPDVISKTVKIVSKILNNKTGTNFHPGGLAMVNDQAGPMFKEYVELPNGVGFIPQARNTVLPLPRGSKVLKASKTKQMFPHYAGGIGQITENTATPTTDFTADLEAQMEQYFVIGADWMQRLIDGWNSLTATHLANVNTFANQNVAALNSWNGQMYTSGYTWLQNNLNGWNALYSTFVNRVNQLANDSVNTLWSKSGDMYNAGNYLMQNLLNGLNSMGSALDGVMRGVANKMLSGIGKGVNGVITGVNHVLKQVESDKTLSSWSVPQYAKGTEGHPGGLAMINDQRGPVHEEYVQMPDGQGFIAKGRDLLVNLPKGAQVLNARLTEKLKKRVDIPHYADGIGDMEIDIEELINNKEVFKKLINDQIQYASIMEPWKNMTSSAVKVMTDQAYEFVKKKAEELFMGSGSRAEFIKNVLAQKGKQYVWGAEGPDTFDCSGLIKWALGQIGISFPHYTGDQWNATDHITEAEAKPGDLIYFGSNASRHVGMYTKKGEMFNASMPNAYGPGNGIGYSPYAAADLWGFARIRQLTDGIASGGGRNYGGNWANAIRDAAKKMRVSINESDVQTILSLIQHESGGNEKIVQSSSVWDINMANGNPARGLLQFIPSTFSAYAVKGYNNIMSGYDQLLALFNNANWRGDIHPWGGWGPTGRRRYENGGLIMHEQIARVGEGNKPEMVIPLTRKARAIQLIDKAKDYLGIGDDAPAVVGGRTDLSAVEGKLDQVIDLLSAILGKDPHYVLDLIKTAREMEPYITKYQSRTQKSNQRRGGIRA